VYAVQGVAEPQSGLATQPLFFLLKDEMRLSAAQSATFFALVGVAWTVKPLYGLLSDVVPLFGTRRRAYLLVTTAMATLGWLRSARFRRTRGVSRSRSSGSPGSASRSRTSSATR
jgi:hypothetical protein